MKIKTLAGLLLLVIAFLIGSYSSQDAGAQSSLGWAKYFSLVDLDDGTGNLVPTVQIHGREPSDRQRTGCDPDEEQLG